MAGTAHELADRYWRDTYTVWEDSEVAWEIVKGEGRYSAIAVVEGFDGGAQDRMARELSKKFVEPVYALDFHKYAAFGVMVFRGGDKGRSAAKIAEPDRTFASDDEEFDYDDEDYDEGEEYTGPFAFAAERGIDIKWWVPEPREIARKVCVVANATIDELQQVYSGDDVTFQQSPAGVLCYGELRTLAVDFAYALPGPVYVVLFYAGTDRFDVTVYGNEARCQAEFVSNRKGERIDAESDPLVNPILGETLPRKILERLHIPPDVLSLDMKPKYVVR